MESIKRLREYVNEKDGWVMSHSHVQAINEIADAIEEEFKEQELAHAFAHSQVYEFASNLKGQLLDFDKMDEQQDAMAANGWVKLPVDADGVPIHIGDELECIEALHPEVPARFKVQDMFYRGNGEWHLRAYPATYDPKKCRHHHEPTAEEVLLELLNEAKHFHSLEEEQEAIAEYAAKLRLAGDE